jgi:hypothetical protein
MKSKDTGGRSPVLPLSLIFVGLGLALGWCVMILPALFMAESGAGLDMGERALVVAPLAVASVLLIAGGRVGRSGVGSGRGGAAFDAAVLAGMATGIGALLALVAAP